MSKSILEAINLRELGTELRRAREKRGFTQEEAANVIQVARTTLTAIEKGERRIKEEELIQLANAYGRSISDFVRPTRPKTEPFLPQFRAVYKRQEMPEIEQEAVNQLEELSRNYVELEEITNKPLKYNYPEEYKVGHMDVDLEAESVAHEERNRLGLGDSPLPILRDFLEQKVGLRIFYIPLEPSRYYSAMYIYDHLLGGCIAINSLHPEEKRRWSLAHEYAHFLAHRYAADIYTESYQRLPERERFADAFASYFLMPTSSLLKLVRENEGNISAADLCIRANYFGVSVEAITRRLEGLKKLPTGTWESLKQKGFRVQEAQRALGLNPIPANAEKLPMRYQYLAVEAFSEEKLSEGQFAKFLQVSRVKAREAAEMLWPYEFSMQQD